MSDFEFSCPNCNQVLEAPGEMAGEVVECPGCQQQMTVPQAPEADAPASESQETGAEESAETVAAAIKCPNCEKEMPGEAVLCVHCGYHLRLGRKITTEFK